VKLPVLGHAHFVEHLADSGGNGFSTTYVGGYDWSCCLRLHCVDLQPCELLSLVTSVVALWELRQSAGGGPAKGGQEELTRTCYGKWADLGPRVL